MEPRPTTLSRILLALLLFLTCFASAAERPNVIVILTDDQGYGDMSCHGNPWLKTPNLDRLHVGSVRFEDYHVDPFCSPSRAALMTGRYCTRIGAWAVTSGRHLLNPDEKTMGDVFSASGYRTGLFGKWHLGDTYPFAPQYRGFQDVVCHRSGGVDEIGNPAGNNYFDDTYFRNGTPEKFSGYCTDVFFRETIRFIRKQDPKPFFVYLPTNAMHSPFTVAEKYWKRFIPMGHSEERAKFFGMIENFDENLGLLLDELKSQNLEHNTLILFMSDNGTAIGGGCGPDGADDGFNAGMRDHKGSVYDGGHRVACFARWPGHLEPGRTVDRLVSHRDWLPTLIELCHLKAPENVKFDGTSIAPLLKGDPSDWPDRTLFVARQGDRLRKSGVPHAVLTEQWRLVNGRLYDIRKDPAQKNDIASQNPEVASRLQAAYDAHFADVSSHDSAYTRIPIGTDAEETTRFTARDWHPTQGNVIWEKPQLHDDSLFINGHWAVDVSRAGHYSIRLSRHAEDEEHPMKASAARVRLGSTDLSKSVDPSAGSVTFSCDLPAGPAILESWLTDAATSRERGAYHITVTRLR